MPARFSERTAWHTSPNPLARAAGRLRSSGRAVIDLTLSNPTQAGFRYLGPGVLEPLRDPAALRYDPDPRGLPAAREAVRAYYAGHGAAVDPERIFLFSGTSEAYAAVFRILADAGEKVLAPRPSYPLFDYLAAAADVELAPYAFERSDRWRLAAGTLDAALPGARAIIAVHPANPTGHYVVGEDREALVRAAEHAGAALLVDEVFLDFPVAPPPGVRTFAGESRVLTFTLGGLSKCAGLPQMKVAWTVLSGPDAERAEAERRLEVLTDAFLTVNTPAQLALGAWLGGRGRAAEEIRGRLLANDRALRAAASGPRVRALGTEGGWTAVLQVRTGLSDEAFALALLEEEGVLVHPGYLFDFAESAEGVFAVVSLLAPPSDFEEGVRRLARAAERAPSAERAP